MHLHTNPCEGRLLNSLSVSELTRPSKWDKRLASFLWSHVEPVQDPAPSYTCCQPWCRRGLDLLLGNGILHLSVLFDIAAQVWDVIAVCDCRSTHLRSIWLSDLHRLQNRKGKTSEGGHLHLQSKCSQLAVSCPFWLHLNWSSQRGRICTCPLSFWLAPA